MKSPFKSTMLHPIIPTPEFPPDRVVDYYNLPKSLPPEYEDIILPMLELNPKLVLGGSIILNMLGIIDFDYKQRCPDFDLSIMEGLTEEDLLIMMDFFNLKLIPGIGGYDLISDDESKCLKKKDKPLSYQLTRPLIQLGKWEDLVRQFKVDIFNIDLDLNEVFYMDYKGYTLKCIHPSHILSYKSKYAFDPRVRAQFKHFNDLQKIDFSYYFDVVRNIKNMKILEKNGIWHFWGNGKLVKKEKELYQRETDKLLELIF